MTLNSIRVRLLLAAGLMIVLALLASGVSIAIIFQRHLETRVAQELDRNFTQLLAALEVKPDGTLDLSKELADPRFDLPLSGLYWQVDLDGKPILRSRSLWDERLVVPTPPKAEEEAHIHELAGPDDQQLYSLERAVYLNHQGKEKLFVVTVGLSRGEISGTVLSMARDVVPALLALGLLLLLATWAQVSLGLKPLAAIQKAVQGIREGEARRVDGNVAEEVKPLVSELNALLDANDSRNRQARQRAADLAHGLRTPLTILGSLSRNIESAGLTEEAEKIRIQTEHMRQQVERELAKAMSSAEEKPIWLELKQSLERLVKVVAMNRTGDDFAWSVEVGESVRLSMTRNDFNEIFGNLLENAQKWGRSRALVRLAGYQVTIEDDGSGVIDANLDKLTHRGFTTGEGSNSSGLGLAIVQQLADKNGIRLNFDRSDLGGLAVRLSLPARMLSDDGHSAASHVQSIGTNEATSAIASTPLIIRN